MADKIAIFGGSFDPLHKGHISVAKSAMKECLLSKVVFLPNANPPHKNREDMTAAIHRYNMVNLGLENYDCFELSDFEMNRKTPSYTVDTMREMKKIYNAELFFIIGADSLYTLNTWKNYDNLIKECSFIVADRNCSEGSALKKEADKINSLGGNITLISMPKIDITSTMIRKGISEGEDVREFLDCKVYEYILKNNLYKSNPED